MAWERKRRGDKVTGYFFKSIRVPGRPHPVKKYLGKGAEAVAEAARMAETRRQRAADKAAIAAAKQKYAAMDELLQRLTALIHTITAEWLTLTGHHYHRGQWRRTRGR